jgi:hypothetical protein
MLRFVLARSLKRVAPAWPVARLLLAADVAVMAGKHLTRLDGAQRRRLFALLRQARGRPSSLGDAEREELETLIAILEPRLFLGSAIKQLSPVPLPKRLLYGARGSRTRRI